MNKDQIIKKLEELDFSHIDRRDKPYAYDHYVCLSMKSRHSMYFVDPCSSEEEADTDYPTFVGANKVLAIVKAAFPGMEVDVTPDEKYWFTINVKVN